MNSTTYAKMTEHKPVDMFFRAVLDAKAKTKKVAFVDVFQVLNDRYLGRMNVCNYFAVAENSVRVNELNIIALEELKNYHLVMKENYFIPDNIVYSIPVSTRFLQSDQDFDILLSALKNNNYKKGSIILSFYGVTLDRLKEDAKKRYIKLRRSGYKTAVAQFGEDFNSIDIFAGFNFNYLRCEASYFDSTPNKKKLLTMLIRFCNANKIGLVMEGVDSTGQLTRFKKAGVKFVTGKAVSQLSRLVTNEFLYLPQPESDKLAAYKQKLQKEIAAKQRSELAELNMLREQAIEKAKTLSEENIMPTAPRPELAKSTYQIRLEQQQNTARKYEEEMLSLQYQSSDNGTNRLGDEMARLRFHGDVQGALSLTFQNKTGLDEINTDDQNAHRDEDNRLYITEEESGVTAPARPNAAQEAEPLTAENIIEAEELVNLTAEDISDEVTDGVDESQPADGKDKDTSLTGGNYNEYGQWVDEDGTVYDGYFDESGRWIDYTFTDTDGEIVDNGYFDDKIGQWVPFGYFDEEGGYHRF